MDENLILEKLTKMIEAKRFQHSIGVKECAEELALLYDIDANRAALAGLLHDCGKGLNKADLIQKCKKYGIEPDPISFYQKELMHGPLGAKIAENEFGIRDSEILSAIEYHTYGKRNMTVLEKIIYLADLIEPSRSFQGVDELRTLAHKDLDKAVLKALDNSMVLVISKGRLIHPNTLEARNYMIMSQIS